MSRVSFISLILVILLQLPSLAGFAKADSVLDSNAAGTVIKNFWAGDEYKTKLGAAMAQTPRIIFNSCGSLKTSPVAVFFLAPFLIGDDKKLKAGMWKESYSFSGCGNDSALNYIFKVNEQQKFILITPLPGESRASYILQGDTLTNVIVATRVHTKTTCADADVINTTVGGLKNNQLVRSDPGSVVANKPWEEVWTVAACGLKMLVPIWFIPDATGTGFSITATDIVDQ